MQNAESESPKYPILKCSSYNLEIGKRTLIMGILNVTPDSFSDGGLYNKLDKALDHAEKMVEDGADIIDVGGESSRPGSEPIPEHIELERILPVIKKLAKKVNTPISIDTYKASVAERALDAGACMVNDITALDDPNMARVLAKFDAPIVLMHKQGTPKNMQVNPSYNSLIPEIIDYLQYKIQLAVDRGIRREQIIIDPGIGFGKTAEHNLEILRDLRKFKILKKPILIGTSRKSFIGKVLNLPVEDRLEGTAATVAIAITNGADIIRVHDVKEMKRVARMTDAIVRTA